MSEKSIVMPNPQVFVFLHSDIAGYWVDCIFQFVSEAERWISSDLNTYYHPGVVITIVDNRD